MSKDGVFDVTLRRADGRIKIHVGWFWVALAAASVWLVLR